MFDEMPPEHFHQFIVSSRPPPPPTPTPTPTPTTQLPPHSLCFSSTTANLFPQFDHHHNYPSHLHLQSQFMLHHKNGDQHREVDHDHHDHDDHHETQLLSSVLELDRDQRSIGVVDQWTNEEVFELIRIRSNMENWFPDLTWNHVSRKLAELGFKKSPQNCKEKFEEESQHFTNNVITNAKNYRFFSELEEIYHGDQNPPVAEEDDDNPPDEENAQPGEDINQMKRQKRKRSRKKEFEKLKEFCEEIVNKMMAQQEELNNKLIHDMLKRDEENLAKEEVRKKQESERINKEIESRAQEHAIAKERQAKITEFLNKFASNSRNLHYHHNKLESASSSSTGPNYNARENPNSGYTLSEKDDTGKRWPRDEVMALINLRSNHYRDDKEGLSRGPLWERISKGMLELGYKRSSKRCKEKWENINKYYKKTKDANKKRSLDSRTCPYFHQLTTLYNQTVFGQPGNHLLLTENHNVIHGHHGDHDNHEGEKNLVLEHRVGL